MPTKKTLPKPKKGLVGTRRKTLPKALPRQATLRRGTTQAERSKASAIREFNAQFTPRGQRVANDSRDPAVRPGATWNAGAGFNAMVRRGAGNAILDATRSRGKPTPVPQGRSVTTVSVKKRQPTSPPKSLPRRSLPTPQKGSPKPSFRLVK